MIPTSQQTHSQRRRHQDPTDQRVLFDTDVVDYIAIDGNLERHQPHHLESAAEHEDSNKSVPSLRLDPASNVSLKHLLPRQFVFIDTSSDNHEEYLRQLVSHGEPLEIVYLDLRKHGIEQMAEVLADHCELEAIHLISKGSDGVIRLGNHMIDRAALALDHAISLRKIGESLTNDADFFIYGCGLKGSTAGSQLTAALARLVGAEVAATDELVNINQDDRQWSFETSNGLGKAKSNCLSQHTTLAQHAESPASDDTLGFCLAFENTSCLPWEAGFSPHFQEQVSRGIRVHGVTIDSGDLSQSGETVDVHQQARLCESVLSLDTIAVAAGSIADELEPGV